MQLIMYTGRIRPMAARPTLPSRWPTTTASAMSLKAQPREEHMAGTHSRRNIRPVK